MKVDMDVSFLPSLVRIKPVKVVVPPSLETRARELFPEITVEVDDKLGPNEWLLLTSNGGGVVGTMEQA